jgi:hypothetical protein
MKPVIMIASPVFEGPAVGQVPMGYAMALWGLGAHLEEKLGTWPAIRSVAVDIVRARSRLVRAFLADDAFTHLLFWDVDVTAPAAQLAVALAGMAHASKAMVGIPYPKKSVHLDRVAAAGVPAAHGYNIKKEAPSAVDGTGCVEVDGLGLGFMLIERACLGTMVLEYSRELSFLDEVVGPNGPEELETVALFQLMFRNGRLLSEDYSFCQRWRDLEGSVHMYLGPGTPLDHVGGYKFTGDIRAILTPRR